MLYKNKFSEKFKRAPLLEIMSEGVPPKDKIAFMLPSSKRDEIDLAIPSTCSGVPLFFTKNINVNV